MSGSRYHIVYPCDDRTRLSVVEICEGLEHELADYAVASRESFTDPKDAHEYASGLSKSHGLTYIPDPHVTGPDYLD